MATASWTQQGDHDAPAGSQTDPSPSRSQVWGAASLATPRSATDLPLSLQARQNGAPRGLCQPNRTGPCPSWVGGPKHAPRLCLLSACNARGPHADLTGHLSLTKPYGIEAPELEAQLKGFTVTTLPQNPGPPTDCSRVPRTGAETTSPPHSAAVTTRPPGCADGLSPKTGYQKELGYCPEVPVAESGSTLKVLLERLDRLKL